MMKLRLATPGVPHRHRRAGGRARLHPRRPHDEVRIGAMTRHRELLESPLLAERLADLHRRRARHRRPVVRNRGTIGGALCQADPSEDLAAVVRGARRAARDPRSGRRARRRHATSSTAARTRPPSATTRCSSRSASRCAPTVRQRLREGRAARRRLGGGRRRALRAPAEDGAIGAGGDRARRRRRRRRPSRAPRRRSCGSAPSEELFERAGAARRRGATPSTDQRGSAEYKRHVAGSSPAARCAGPTARAPASRRLHAGDGGGQRRGASHARSSRGCCSSTSCATSWA